MPKNERSRAPRHDRLLWLAACLAIIVGILALPVILARRTHDRDLRDLRRQVTAGLGQLGYRVVSITAGFDGGGSGSADCGVHTRTLIASDQTTRSVRHSLRRGALPVTTVFRASARGQFVVVSAGPATTGADSLLDFRCTGPIPSR